MSWLEPFAEGRGFVFEGVRAFLAFSYLQAGRREAARAMLDEVSATGFERVPVGMVARPVASPSGRRWQRGRRTPTR